MYYGRYISLFHVCNPMSSCTWTDGITYVVPTVYVRGTKTESGQKILIKACPPVNLTGIYDKIRSVRTFDVFVWLL